MTGDSYTPKQGSRVILYLKPHAEGYEGDRIQGKVLSVVSYRAPTWTTNHGDVVKGDEEDRLRVQLQTSWGVAGVPLDEVQMYTNLDAEERRLEAAERAGLIRRPVTLAEWKRSSDDARFDDEKADMIGVVDVELVKPPRRDPRRTEE